VSDLDSAVIRAVDLYLGGGNGQLGTNRFHERHAIVTSYDPGKYLAKVMLMPEGTETGWLPIETGAIGDSYGIAHGLQPGDGKNSGDQVIVRMQEGDIGSCKIVQRVHSDADKPPKVESGEFVIWAKFKKSKGQSGLGDDTDDSASGDDSDQADSGQGGSGQQFYFKKDGSITITDGNGATLVMDGNGNVSLNCKKFSAHATDTISVRSDSDITVSAGGKVTVTAASEMDLNGSPIKFNGGGPELPPFQITG